MNLYLKFCNLDIKFAVLQDYVHVCESAKLNLNAQLSIKEYQELLLDQVIASNLPNDCLTFIYDFPEDQAALARLNDNGRAERFELYLGNVELANGFQELTDSNEQLKRFKLDNQIRRLNSKAEIEIDKNLISALHAGMPDCSGVAMGIDRLLALMQGVSDIKQILTFPNG